MSVATNLPDLDDAACLKALALLVDIGCSLAEELQAPSAEVTVVDRADAFEGVALAVRRTIILSRHIARDEPAPASRERRRAAVRKEVLRGVEDKIDRKTDPAEAASLRVELLERLDAPEFDADLTHRSPAELIAELCRDLGLANIPGVASFPRRTPDDIAILCAQAAAPAGSGLPRWRASLSGNADPPH